MTAMGSPMDKFTERLAIVETKQEAMASLLEKTEGRLVGMLSELREVVLDRIDHLNHAINGNGSKGLLERVTELEKASAHRDGADERSDKTWVKLGPFAPWIAGIFMAALAYFVGKSR